MRIFISAFIVLYYVVSHFEWAQLFFANDERRWLSTSGCNLVSHKQPTGCFRAHLPGRCITRVAHATHPPRNRQRPRMLPGAPAECPWRTWQFPLSSPLPNPGYRRDVPNPGYRRHFWRDIRNPEAIDIPHVPWRRWPRYTEMHKLADEGARFEPEEGPFLHKWVGDP